MLDMQVQVYSLDTGHFYSNREAYIDLKVHKLRTERNDLIRRIQRIEKELKGYGITENDISSILLNKCNYSDWNNFKDICKLAKEHSDCKKWVVDKSKKIKKNKLILLGILKNKVNENIKTNGKHHIRLLNENLISNTNMVSVFESTLTRTIKAMPNELSEDFMIVQVYYFDVIKDLINFGFIYKGEKYIYFSSSAGQIRKKKCMFIKESSWESCKNIIMCGLSVEHINEKGGCNPNKYLAYLALSNSATDIWNEFDIDKAIVIDDFETQVYGTYDFIDETDYSIERVSGYVPVPHTDGAGMILPNAFGNNQRNRMVRLPWIKGLLGVFNYKKFIEVNNCSPIVTDIYGKEHDVIAEDIQVIFTRSQFKMHKYYTSWNQYKNFFKEYGCTACYTNIEADRIQNSSINYQMLQTLTDITDEEIINIVSDSNNALLTLCDSIENIQKVFGVTPYNLNKTAFQKSVELYPALLNDMSIKTVLKDIKNSMVKQYKSGKLKIYGKYTFVLPDFYAACEYWFENMKRPRGLLDDGEVFCWLFPKTEKLDCLRSPHLYKEHAIRKNLAYKDYKDREQLREWFGTNAIYTSSHDLISKMLQLDVDGDQLLVVADKYFVDIAERNMKDIVPLYYNMRKAGSVKLSPQALYDGLCTAFTGGNIGMYSNNISKIWNNDIFISGSDQEKQHALDCIKRLCCQNNFVIDYSKTLYKPEFPKNIRDEINNFTNENVPHFFIYAKDKERLQVKEKNQSFVNRLEDIIVNPRINCRKLGLKEIDYRLMMTNPNIEVKVSYLNNGQIDKQLTNPIVVKYLELSKICYYRLDYQTTNDIHGDSLRNSKLIQNVKFNKAIKETKSELSQFGCTDLDISDVLVKFLYQIKPNKYKLLLWNCYGDIIYRNLCENIKPNTKCVQCIDCGEWFYVTVKNTLSCRCKECNDLHKRLLKKERNRRYYLNKNN